MVAQLRCADAVGHLRDTSSSALRNRRRPPRTPSVAGAGIPGRDGRVSLTRSPDKWPSEADEAGAGQ
jgi:hypothetical protein